MMICQREPTFRLLDARVGWDLQEKESVGVALEGPGDEARVVLKTKHPHEVSEEEVLPWFFPPWLARGLSEGEWLLAPPRHTLLRLGPRGTGFTAWGPRLHRADAVASDCRRWIAAVDGRAGEVLLLDIEGRVGTRIARTAPEVVALTPWNEVLVAAEHHVWRFSLEGNARGRLPARFHQVVAVRADTQGKVWVVSRDSSGHLRLSRFHRSGARLEEASPALLPQVLPPTGVRLWSDAGFCWTEEAAVAPCLGRDGQPLEAKAVRPFGHRAREDEGTLFTLPLDSGEPRTLWHRVRLDADVPLGTSVRAAVATLDAPDEEVPEDGWFEAPEGALDFLSTAPPGRYLRLRLSLRGGEGLTPGIRQVRIDFPRVTSADLLPSVYLEEPRAADFTARFTAMFDAELERMDSAIERFPALLSVERARPELLSWLGGFLGLAFDSSWDDERRRAFMREAPELFRARGTPHGFLRALELACGTKPALLEHGNPFGAVGHTTVVGTTRLYGRNRRRFRLDRSALGKSALRGFGNPDADPHHEAAHRFSVLFPPEVGRTSLERKWLTALVQALKPAHTAAHIRFGGSFVVGTSSTVGIDTALLPLPVPVLGQTSRLSRTTILQPSPKARIPGLLVEWPVVGITTSLGRSNP